MATVETVFNTDMIKNFCDRCRNEMEWRSWEYQEYSCCQYEGNEYNCPTVQLEFFDNDK